MNPKNSAPNTFCQIHLNKLCLILCDELIPALNQFHSVSVEFELPY